MASLFFLYFLLFLLPLYPVHTYPQCPLFFCGSLGEVGFPFINTNGSGGDCGSIILNCSDDMAAKVQFHDQGKWYLVKKLHYFRKIIIITDSELQSHLDSNHCESLSNFTDGPVASYSFFYNITTPSFPFFKCKKKAQTRHDLFAPDVLRSHAYKFTGCTDDYELYFPEEDNSSLPFLPVSLSKICSTVQLPKPLSWDPNEIVLGDEDLIEVASGWHPWNESIIDLTSLWGATYILKWSVQPNCGQCLIEGGSCPEHQNGTFQCGGLKGKHKKGAKIAIDGRYRSIWWALVASKVTMVGKFFSLSAFAIALIVTSSYCFLRKRDFATSSIVFWKKTNNAPWVEDFLQCHASLTPKRYSYSDIKNMTRDFKYKLGQGGYGEVFKGKQPDGCFVAVKVLNESKGNGEDFMNEVASISRTSHVNIVRLVGFCIEGSARALVYEFMPNGSLDKFIYNKPCSALNLEMLYAIAIGIARGLEYLHRGCRTRIVHFDIKPHNILLDENFCPRISDFGLAKLCQRKESIISMLGARGTIGYIAPEQVCVNFGRVSHKSDVYSYGMMVLEMVGGRHNTDVGVDRTSEIYFPHWIHQRLEQGEEDLRIDGIESMAEKEIAKKMILVGLWCIQTIPTNRPTMSKVLEMLEGSLESLETPPKPFLCSPERSPLESSSN